MRLFAQHLRFYTILGLLSAFVGRHAAADTRIALRADMVINETALGDAAKLVDEQSAIGDPGKGKGVRPVQPFFPGWTAWQYPVHLFVDLKGIYRVTRVMLFNETGEHPLTLSTGQPFAWKDRSIKLGGYREWQSFTINDTTRYVRLTLPEPTSLPEIAIYGDRVGEVAVRKKSAARRSPPTIDQFIGTNAFIDDPIDKLSAPVGFVREYHSWQWDTEAPDHLVRFQPSGAAGGSAWFFDDFYRKLREQHITVCPAIQQSSPVYFPGTDLDAKPITAGSDSEKAASYATHAAHLFQFAARYGATKVDDARLRLGPGQPRSSGLRALDYIENWNEPDKTWRGRAGRFMPYELAAMCSADYDGDQGRMGTLCGVRQADPKMRMAIGGLAGIRLDYLQAMKVWADAHRGGDFPADVINLHHYSSDGTEEQAFKTTGISPEADHLREKLAEIVAWRNAEVPKCEVWLTEFGYDTDPRSPIHSPAIGSYSGEEVQAMWLLRSYFALAAAGVDRAAMFMFRDVKSDGGGVFETCGMVTEKGQWRPKPSYYYIGTLKRRLAGMRFAGEVATGRADVLVYRFARPNGQTALVVWCPTGDDHRVGVFQLPVSAKSAMRVDFTAGSLDGKATPAVIEYGRVTLEAREKPVLFLLE